jgi:hypothetical protein
MLIDLHVGSCNRQEYVQEEGTGKVGAKTIRRK